jgi:hypothetical protein
MRLLWFLTGVTLLLGPAAALAQQGIISQTAQQVAGPLQAFFGDGCSGADCAISSAEFVIARIQMVLSAIAIFVIARNAITMIYSSVDDEQQRAKKAIGTTLAGLMLCYLAPRFVVAFFTAGGEEGVLATADGAVAGATALSEELFGVVRWILVLFASLCVLVLIVTGITALTNPNSEDGQAKIKQSVTNVALACLLLVTVEALKATLGLQDFGELGAPTPYPIIARVVVMLSTVLAGLIVVALVIVVYAGIRMILSVGNEEPYNAAKSLIIRSGIGLVVILVSYVVASFIISFLST